MILDAPSALADATANNPMGPQPITTTDPPDTSSSRTARSEVPSGSSMAATRGGIAAGTL